MTQLLRAAIPVVSAHAPGVVMSREHADAAMAAVRKSAVFSNLQGISLVDGIDMLTDGQRNLAATRVFEENVNRLRGELYVGDHDDPARRLELHQLLMTAGFYARAANQHSTKQDPTRFLANHYNFDVRRDKIILGAVRDAVYGAAQPESNKVLGDLLITERHLFGAHRLQPISGRQYLLPGVSLRLVKTEEELKRLLELEPVQKHGNFELFYEQDENRIQYLGTGWKKAGYARQAKAVHERWEKAHVRCRPEAEAPIAPPVKIYDDESMTDFQLRVLRAPPLVSLSERIKEKLLQLWVYWFSFWMLFWMVDEEVITLVGLIYARYKQLQVLKEEAKRSGGKIYIATSRFN
jgi:hypothetical protein